MPKAEENFGVPRRHERQLSFKLMGIRSLSQDRGLPFCLARIHEQFSVTNHASRARNLPVPEESNRPVKILAVRLQAFLVCGNDPAFYVPDFLKNGCLLPRSFFAPLNQSKGLAIKAAVVIHHRSKPVFIMKKRAAQIVSLKGLPEIRGQGRLPRFLPIIFNPLAPRPSFDSNH